MRLSLELELELPAARVHGGQRVRTGPLTEKRANTSRKTSTEPNCAPHSVSTPTTSKLVL